MSCQGARRRRVAATSCIHVRPRNDPRLPVDPVALVRRQLKDLGHSTSSPDIFWCPCHDGRAPALKVTRAVGRQDEGLATLVCATGCAPADILRALGLQLMRPRDPDLPQHLHLVLPLAVDVSV